jgi:hypothetical protein
VRGRLVEKQATKSASAFSRQRCSRFFYPLSDDLKKPLNKLMLAYHSKNPRSGWKHKAWGGAERNPRMTKGKKTERAKRAIAQKLRFVRLSPTSRALPLYSNDPGVPLRSTPGFMLSPRFAGSMANSSATCSDVPEICRYIAPLVRLTQKSCNDSVARLERFA